MTLYNAVITTETGTVNTFVKGSTPNEAIDKIKDITDFKKISLYGTFKLGEVFIVDKLIKTY